MAAIYGVVCQVTNKVYVGCTKNVSKRWREHRCLLRNGKHAEAGMQADWQAHGEPAFRIQVFKSWPDRLPTTAEKREAELKWMDIFATEGMLYNANRTSFQLSSYAMAKGAANAHNRPGKRWTPEANEKRRSAQLGKPKGHGAKISATKRAKRDLQGDEIV